jgi:hypothetical protein
MKIVMQCASSKRPDAGSLKSADGRPLVFVADPQSAPPNVGVVYARPDDLSDSRTSWREVLVEYNRTGAGNPLRLYPAYELYQNRAYNRMVDRFGLDKVFILSAGWGLIRADFLTPQYDITYSRSAEKYKRRRKTDTFRDFCQLTDDEADEVVFFGGKDYLDLFCELTRDLSGEKKVFYNSSRTPQIPGVSFERFETRTRTNWHYECIRTFLSTRRH